MPVGVGGGGERELGAEDDKTHLRPRSGPAAWFAAVVGTAAAVGGARARRVAAAAANGGRPVAVLAPRPVVARPRGHVYGRRGRLEDGRRRVRGAVAACRRRRAAERLGVMHFHGANDGGRRMRRSRRREHAAHTDTDDAQRTPTND